MRLRMNYIDLTVTTEDRHNIIAPTAERAVSELSDFFNGGKIDSVTLAEKNSYGGWLDTKQVITVAEAMIKGFGANEDGTINKEDLVYNGIYFGYALPERLNHTVDARQLAIALVTFDENADGILTENEFTTGIKDAIINTTEFLRDYNLNRASFNNLSVDYMNDVNNEVNKSLNNNNINPNNKREETNTQIQTQGSQIQNNTNTDNINVNNETISSTQPKDTQSQNNTNTNNINPNNETISSTQHHAFLGKKKNQERMKSFTPNYLFKKILYMMQMRNLHDVKNIAQYINENQTN